MGQGPTLHLRLSKAHGDLAFVSTLEQWIPNLTSDITPGLCDSLPFHSECFL